MNCKQRNRDVVIFFYYLLFVFYHAAENAMLGSWKKNNRCCCASSWVLPGYCRAVRIANWINWTSNFSLLSSLVWMLENLFFVHVLCVLQYVGEWGDGFWSQSSVVNCVSCPRIVNSMKYKNTSQLVPGYCDLILMLWLPEKEHIVPGSLTGNLNFNFTIPKVNNNVSF